MKKICKISKFGRPLNKFYFLIRIQIRNSDPHSKKWLLPDPQKNICRLCDCCSVVYSTFFLHLYSTLQFISVPDPNSNPKVILFGRIFLNTFLAKTICLQIFKVYVTCEFSCPGKVPNKIQCCGSGRIRNYLPDPE